MAFEYNKLVGRIVEKYGTRTAFAAAVGMTESALSARLNNKTPFSAPEISRACAALGIPESDISTYFFTLKVE